MKKVIIPDIPFSALDEKGKPQRVSATQQLQQIASTPKEGQTLTIEDIRQRLPLVDKLAAAVENGGTEVLLEESEHKTLLEVVQASTWMGVSRAALALVEAVEKAETIEVVEGPEQRPNRAERRRSAKQEA